MNQRKQKAKVMMQTVGNFAQVDTNKFEIKSQTDPNKLYNISRTGKGLVYVCKNHTIRRADCKHIQLVKCIMITNRGYTNNNFRIME